MYMLKLPCTGFNLNKLLVNFEHGYSPILMRKLRRLPSHTRRHAFHVLYFSYLYINTLNLKQKLMTSDLIFFAEFSFSLPFSWFYMVSKLLLNSIHDFLGWSLLPFTQAFLNYDKGHNIVMNWQQFVNHTLSHILTCICSKIYD